MVKVGCWNFFLEMKRDDFELASHIFSVAPNKTLVNMCLNAQLANSRQGTASAKNRSEVIGTTRKPWAQKKTGRARVGNAKSPLWRGGGVIFGPVVRSYRVDLSKKMRQKALFSVLSFLVRDRKVLLLEDVKLDKISTALFLRKMKLILPECEKKAFRCVMILSNRGSAGEGYSFVRKSANNLPWLLVVHVDALELKDLYYADCVIFEKVAYDEFVGRYSDKSLKSRA